MIPGDIAKIEYLPSDNYLKTQTQISLIFELNTVFGLSKQKHIFKDRKQI